MEFYSDILKEGKLTTRDSVVAIGNFDGVHLGHQSILSHLKDYPDYTKVIMTFKPHPVLFVRPEKNLKLIVADYYDRVDSLSQFKPDCIFLQEFSDALKNLSALEFIKILKEKLNLKVLIVGDDYNFGKNREGNVSYLKSIASDFDFELLVIPQIEENNQRITSSYVRKLLKEGDIDQVNDYIHKPYFIKGFVETGLARGRELGFPTINFKSYAPHQAYPGDGVYITLTKIDGDPKVHQSMTNIGKNPTFGERKRRIETHIFDFNENIYFKKVRITFLSRIREEMKFTSVEALIEQIKKDQNIALQYFESHPNTQF